MQKPSTPVISQVAGTQGLLLAHIFPCRDCPLVARPWKYLPGRQGDQDAGGTGSFSTGSVYPGMGPARSPPRHPRPSQDLWSTEQLADGEGSFALALLCFAHQNTIPIQLRTLWRSAQRPAPTPRAPTLPSLTGTLTRAITAQTFRSDLVRPAIPPSRHTAAAPPASQIC